MVLSDWITALLVKVCGYLEVYFGASEQRKLAKMVQPHHTEREMVVNSNLYQMQENGCTFVLI